MIWQPYSDSNSCTTQQLQYLYQKAATFVLAFGHHAVLVTAYETCIGSLCFALSKFTELF